MYAIIESGGKQYKVAPNDAVRVEKLDVPVGETVEIDRVLLVSTEEGVRIGSPVVEGAAVVAKVVRQGKGRKIHGFTYKPKKHTHRHYGHRQLFTELKVEQIKV